MGKQLTLPLTGLRIFEGERPGGSDHEKKAPKATTIRFPGWTEAGIGALGTRAGAVCLGMAVAHDAVRAVLTFRDIHEVEPTVVSAWWEITVEERAPDYEEALEEVSCESTNEESED